MAYAEYSEEQLRRMGVISEPRRDAPTERQLEWCRKNIPHFATAERQAKAARERRA